MTGLQPDGIPKEKIPFFRRLADLFRQLYRDERAMWNAHYQRYFKIAARALALGFVLGFVYFMARPAQERKALAFVMKSLKDIPLGAPPLVLALTLFYHNARASVIAVAAGVVPLACLPVLDPIANGATLGLLASVSKHQGLNVPLLFLKSVAPHGIFELPAVLYAASVGIYLSLALGKLAREAWRKKRGRELRGGAAAPAPDGPDDSSGVAALGQDLAGKVVRSLGLVVLPLLLVAAVIEAFITPLLR
ncbi:MAG: stage II sporulation protein M [Candidatus Aminicenantales bacterium]|jgi:stage II sporulation protein M